MTRIVYVNGRYRQYRDALVHAEDRGFQFGDAVYEVCEIYNGGLVDQARHLERLTRSLGELGIRPPMGPAALRQVMRETVRRNRVVNGLLYLQVTRGVAPRDFTMPPHGTPSTLICLARRGDPARFADQAQHGIAVITVPDIRWGRCDIKTTMLLPAVLAKDTARKAGAKEAWLVDRDGFVTEGSASNAWIVTADGRLVTRGLGHQLLPGVTRRTVIDILAQECLVLEERGFTPEEAKGAREAFITSATNTVMPVISIDGKAIGNGAPGSIALHLRTIFHSIASVTK